MLKSINYTRGKLMKKNVIKIIAATLTLFLFCSNGVKAETQKECITIEEKKEYLCEKGMLSCKALTFRLRFK